MKNIFTIAFSISLLLAQAQYWQQEVDYKMNIDLNEETNIYKGNSEIRYINNSPDSLQQVFIHLYFNAFQPNSMMDVRSRTISDPDKRVGSRIEKLAPSEIGSYTFSQVSMDGQELEYTIEQTIMKIKLPKALAPNSEMLLNLKFDAQIPIQIRRSGRDNSEGIDYTMTQWYPKMAEYDRDGWHIEPYVGREFYGVFGNFDVEITTNSDLIIGGSGVLQNDSEIWEEKKLKDGMQFYQMKKSKSKTRVWKFKAEKVHDFAWAADQDYIRYSVEGPNDIIINAYYLKSEASNWEKLSEYTPKFFVEMNQYFGEYPYPQFSIIQGGDGGMEYPMCTMLKGTGKLDGLIGVFVHEAAHNWYYGILATNEFRYPWMDEGFTSYAEAEVLNIIKEENLENPHLRALDLNNKYLTVLKNPEPLGTPGDYYSTNQNYGLSAYIRGEAFLTQLKYIVGEESFNQIMLAYFDEWKFKHPNPWDFIKVAEDVSGIQLDWYLNYFLYTTKHIDYAVEEVASAPDQKIKISLKRKGDFPMPVRLLITTKSGAQLEYYIPLVSMQGSPKNSEIIMKAWPWTHPTYELLLEMDINNVLSVEIDPNLNTSDAVSDDNVWTNELLMEE